MKTFCQGPVCPTPPACDLTPSVFFPPGGTVPAASLSSVRVGAQTFDATDLETLGSCSRLGSVTVELTAKTIGTATVTLNGDNIVLTNIGDKVTFNGESAWSVAVTANATVTASFACYS